MKAVDLYDVITLYPEQTGFMYVSDNEQIQPNQCLISIYGWPRSRQMREDITNVTSLLIGRDLVQP